MIRPCGPGDFERMHAIINEAAEAYRGVIPADRWKTPYMPAEELREEMRHGVAFLGYEEGGSLVGVMGAQPVEDVRLIRHAYVVPARQKRGIGAALLAELRRDASRPFLVGTWAAARWALRFYEAHGFRLVPPEDKITLLKRYWSIPARQIETSVVLADPAWFAKHGRSRGNESSSPPG